VFPVPRLWERSPSFIPSPGRFPDREMSTDHSHGRTCQANPRRRQPRNAQSARLGSRIRQALATDGPLELGALSTRVDDHPARVERRCRELARRGKIRVIGSGRYDI
jgi:hypothetical protein